MSRSLSDEEGEKYHRVWGGPEARKRGVGENERNSTWLERRTEVEAVGMSLGAKQGPGPCPQGGREPRQVRIWVTTWSDSRGGKIPWARCGG